MAARGRSNADALLILALAQGKTVAEAARAAGVAERTVYRRLQDPAFMLRVDEAQEDIVGRAVGLLAAGTVDAVATLRKLATEGDEPIQLKASIELLEQYSRLRDAHQAQVSSLESRASELRPPADSMTVDEAVRMLAEAGPDALQQQRAWTLIKARMDPTTLRTFRTKLEVAVAERDWEEHRRPRPPARPTKDQPREPGPARRGPRRPQPPDMGPG